MKRAVVILLAALTLACGGPRPLPVNACRPAEEGDHTNPWEHRSYTMTVPWFAPRRGAERPRVVIQEFSDFECPYCARANPTVDQVLEEYRDCVQVVWRNYPLRYHPNARLAARAAMEVYRQGGDEAFWPYHDRLFANQAHLQRADLEREASTIEGIDMDAFREALDTDAHESTLERDRRAVADHEVRIGTPTFVVNGVIVSGARPITEFRLAIDDALRARIYGEGPGVPPTDDDTAGGELREIGPEEPPPEGEAVPDGPSDPRIEAPPEGDEGTDEVPPPPTDDLDSEAAAEAP